MENRFADANRWSAEQDKNAFGADVGLTQTILCFRTAVSSDSLVRCLPAASKFPGSSHASNAPWSAGHSASMTVNHAVSRLRPL